MWFDRNQYSYLSLIFCSLTFTRSAASTFILCSFQFTFLSLFPFLCWFFFVFFFFFLSWFSVLVHLGFFVIGSISLMQKPCYCAISALFLHYTIYSSSFLNLYGFAQLSRNEKSYCTIVDLRNPYMIKTRNISVFHDVP